MDRSEIRKLNDEIQILKAKYANSLDSVNYEYWPFMAKLKRTKKLTSFFATLAFIALFIVILWIVLCHIKDLFKIIFSSSLVVCLCILSTVFDIIFQKKIDKANKEWNKNLVNPDTIKDEIKNKSIIAVNEMLATFDNKEEVIEKIGTSYEDVYEYYRNSINMQE